MKAKRRAVAIILYATAKGLGVSLDMMKQAFSEEHKGGLKESDTRTIRKKYEKGRILVDDIRRIALHLWETSKK